MNKKFEQYKELSNQNLSGIQGGKFSFLMPNWSQARDSIWGFVDGVMGYKHKSNKKRHY
ncbi:hypothetical protein [Lactiplantibacillus xiangfangensis]|uniref:hypothetical protein n=1 Tax=Lactiplantibacillus xiangfangensis TaxID=942150 RepID=UPI000AB1EAAD|nr:hypothetical protein [Lactiplantibacillus xiangfangensis]